MLLDLATGQTRRLDSAWYDYGGGYLAWSWDGQYLLARGARSSKNQSGVALIDVAGGTVRDLTGIFGSTRYNALAFHPNGKSISWTETRNEDHFWAIDK